MFDFENPFEDVQVKEQVPCNTDSVSWDEADWEQITADHADDAKEVSPDRIYRKAHAKRKERTAIASARYAALAIGLTAIVWAVRDVTWLAVTLGSIALVFAIISAFGAGKCREM